MRRLTGLSRAAYSRARRHLRPARLRFAALDGEVQIATDEFGVPHIEALSAHDLFFAQGYVTARDRMFQLDATRRGARGRLCELYGLRPLPWRELSVHLKGRTTLDVDILMRTFGIEATARANLALHSQESREILAAYAEGVNAFLATGACSLEHRLLRAHMADWEPLDSLSLLRGIAFELNFAWRVILANSLLAAAHVPAEIARMLWPHYAEGASIVEREGWGEMVREVAFERQAASIALGFGNAAGVGSNCFAVAGTHTLDGSALLANDTHMVLQAPNAWHEVRLRGGGFDLRGFALAGVPGVIIGRTPHHAWGATAALVQDLDLFVEKRSKNGVETYLTPEGEKPLRVREETFVIRDRAPVVRRIYESHHGPLIDSLSTAPAPATGDCFAVAWTGTRPGRDLDALLGMWRARTLHEFDAALEHHVCPPFNVTVASAGGRIAYRLAGVIPRRQRNTPLAPLPGWTSEWDWEEGEVPREYRPRAQDPMSGFIVTANNRIVPDSYPFELGDLFESSDRFDRIRARLLELGDKITFEDLASLQLDTYSRWGVRVRQALLAAAGGKQELNKSGKALLQHALETWIAWDGVASASSAGAAIGYVTAWRVGRDLIRRLASDDAALSFLELAGCACDPLLNLLSARDKLAKLGIDLADVVRGSFESAVHTCRNAMGSNVARWSWGQMHPILVKHRLPGITGRLLSIGPEPASGGLETVNRGDFAGPSSFRLVVGASMRFVASSADVDATGSVLPGGQSGDPLSVHYDDQLPLFLAGRLKRAPMSSPLSVSHQEHWLPAR